MSGFDVRYARWMVLALAAGSLTACGDKKEEPAPTDAVKSREAMPFVHIKLKNTGPKPASATAAPTQGGAPRPPLTVNSVPPNGGEGTSTPPGNQGADAVTITVNFQGGGTLRGSGSFVGQSIGSIDPITVTESSGTARVNFASGQPAATINLAP